MPAGSHKRPAGMSPPGFQAPFHEPENAMDPSIAILTVSLLVGICGMNRKFGFWGYFFCSLALTPFIAVIALLASGKRKTA